MCKHTIQSTCSINLLHQLAPSTCSINLLHQLAPSTSRSGLVTIRLRDTHKPMIAPHHILLATKGRHTQVHSTLNTPAPLPPQPTKTPPTMHTCCTGSGTVKHRGHEKVAHSIHLLHCLHSPRKHPIRPPAPSYPSCTSPESPFFWTPTHYAAASAAAAAASAAGVSCKMQEGEGREENRLILILIL